MKEETAERRLVAIDNLQAEILELESQRARARTRAARRPINKRLHHLRAILVSVEGLGR